MLFIRCLWRMPKRYWITILVFAGDFLLNLMRVNLSIAIVEMTSNKTIPIGNKTEIVKADYNWSSMEKGFILSAFPCGFAFAILGGFLINRFGGASVFGATMALTAVLSILSPLLLHIHVYVFMFGRALEGLLEGFAVSSTVDVLAHWSPVTERTRLLSFAKVAKHCSAAVNYPLSGYVAYTLGWQAIFYTAGAATLIWYLIWVMFVSNDPQDDKFVSEEEKSFLKNSIPSISNEKAIIPWKNILSSKAMYALFYEYFTVAWAPSFLVSYLPIYIKDVHNVSIKDVGLISGLPLVCGIIIMPIAACIADYLRSNMYSISKVHKLYIFWGEFLVSLSLLVAALNGDFITSLICFCCLRIAFSFASTSYDVICVDMAGQYAGVVRAMCGTCFSIGSFLNPLVMGYIVQHKTQSEWNCYFFVLCGVTVWGVVMFLVLLDSAELQPWAVVPKRKNVQSNTNEVQSS